MRCVSSNLGSESLISTSGDGPCLKRVSLKNIYFLTTSRNFSFSNMNHQETYEADVLIVGTVGAELRAAIECDERKMQMKNGK